MAKKAETNIVKYQKSHHLSIGFIIMSVMSIYIAYHMFTYLTASNLTIYEVTAGSISSNHEYNALCIREEEIVSTTSSGDIVYMVPNLTRVGAKTSIYAVDETGNVTSQMKADTAATTKISAADRQRLSYSINDFVLNYNPNDFGDVYSYKADLTSQIEQIYNLSAMDALSAQIGSALSGGSFHKFSSAIPGLVVFSKDGMEGIKASDVTTEMLSATNTDITNLKTDEKVRSGQEIYKIVTSDKWQLVMEVDDELYDQLKDDGYIEIQFLEDKVNTWCALSFIEKGPSKYLVLDLDDGMDRYASARFVKIKLLDASASGLKIPNTSITEKEFFKVPSKYFFKGGNNSTELGLLVVKEGGATEFVSTSVFKVPEVENYYYLPEEIVPAGTNVVRANSNDTYMIGSDTDILRGVYNVNKGYAVFKQIEIIYENKEYTIVKNGTDHGVALFDHISLDGNAVQENEIINKSTND